MELHNTGSELKEEYDRRRHPRIKKALPICFTVFDVDGTSGIPLPRYDAQTHDIGIGGVSCNAVIDDKTVVEELSAKKRKVNLNIRLMEKNSDISAKADVAWIYNLQGLSVKTKYGLGLSFVNMGKAENDLLSSYIGKMIVPKQDQRTKKVILFLRRHKSLFAFAKAIQNMKPYWYRQKWFFIRSHAIKSYLDSHQVRKLQIGAGIYCLDGWFNTDILPNSNGCYFLDARKTFPFGDSTFDYIYSEHMIEHLTYNEGRSMLHECYRILKHGGRIRIATPDLEAIIGLYRSEKSDLQQRYMKWVIKSFLPNIGGYGQSFVINYMFQNWGHKFIYDRTTLQSLLEEVGFADISYHAVGESNDENLAGLESHGIGSEDEEMVRFETMVIEGRRP
jgi:predicted SAM-dependent methyltransferase